MRKTLIDIDPWLKPFATTIKSRIRYIEGKSKQLVGDKSLSELALGHLYYGLHETADGWILREWAPNATAIFLVTETNHWEDTAEFAFTKLSLGNWELKIPKKSLKHLQHYKLHIHWQGGSGYRIPAYATYVVQDEKTHGFDSVVWAPATSFSWSDESFVPSTDPPLIYEAHVGMSSELPEVASYAYFTKNILPRIKKAGYNTIQLMAIQEHPYYGSFGYHVTNFFAASSRFGTPNDLKKLVDTAHKLGLRVVLDVVHSHAAKNVEEGLSRFDGTENQYFHPGERGNHEAWDSRVFDYGKNQVLHFLLSNLRFWLDEYHFDGFRFDGVTSMLYTHHGLAKDFVEYADYYKDDVDKDALAYLTLANKLVHEVKPSALTFAEDMSGFPGIAGPLDYGGQGFDYRLSMGVPDLWIKTLKEVKDEDWNISHLYHELTTRRPEERVISYAESHDQALVGDQTLLFRLLEAHIYEHMQVNDSDLIVERGIALHKIIRLLTASLNGGGYLNFIGNEFGHPEWVDFPREGNNWSCHYARRQWSLADDKLLKYQWLGAFDRTMLDVIVQLKSSPEYTHIHDDDQILSFLRNGYLFVFNLSPDKSYENYSLPAPAGSYEVAFSTDDKVFGGQQRISHDLEYFTANHNKHSEVKLYLPARTATVFAFKKS